MTNVMAKSNENDTDSRLTIRIDPEYSEALDKASKELGLNKSIIIRNAIQEYVERQERHFSPALFRFFLKWRQDRKRYNMP
jgi:predicted transcriptional regulator